MQVSEKGLELTKSSEGLRLKAYQDTGGVWTIGYGHTRNVYPGQIISQDDAARFLKTDMEYAVSVVNEHCLPCTQGQFDALCDFVFNVGVNQFLHSTLFRLHKAGDYKNAAAQFQKWKYDNGKIIPGLIVRRSKELATYTRLV